MQTPDELISLNHLQFTRNQKDKIVQQMNWTQ
jgi:hypothetical protein